MKKYICIDIGGTAIKHGVADEGLRLLEKARYQPKARLTEGRELLRKS